MTPSAVESPAGLIITGCTVLTHDDQGETGFLENAAVVVRDGVVEEVTDAGAVAGRAADEWIDARGQVALPGLINCHTHAPMAALRGLAEDLPTEAWFNDVVWPVESNLTERDVTLGARLACAEMIRAGVTCFADHYFHMDAVAEVVAASGMRALLGRRTSPRRAPRDGSVPWSSRSATGARPAGGSPPRSPRTPPTPWTTPTSPRPPSWPAHGLPVHLHAAENRDQTEASLARHGVTPVEVLHRTGILDTDVLIAHGTGIVESDLALLADARGRTAVATAPRGYLKFAWPTTTPVRALRDIGVPVGLATDGAASNNSLDVWESMALTSLIQKSTEGDPRWMTARQALHHATLQSARAVGLEGSVGRIAPGHRADLVLVDLTGPHTQPVHDLAATLVHSARAADVRTTVVDGRILMRDRRLLTVDVPGTVRELDERLPALVDRGHGRRIQEYDT